MQFSYPTSNSKKEIWVSSFGIALTVYFFLIVFQPFGTYNYSHSYKYLLLVPYALITFAVFSTGNFLLFQVFQKWRLKEELIKITLFLSLCSFLNYCYSIYFINNTDFNFRTLLYMGIFTFSVGIPICTLYFLARYIYLSRINSSNIEQAVLSNDTPVIENLTINPTFGNRAEMQRNSFIYAQSQGNYSEIYYLEKLELKKEFIRISLKTLEEQICDKSIMRCHRSFIINTNHIIKRRGNTQGYKIKLKSIKESIPVSRKYMDKVLNDDCK